MEELKSTLNEYGKVITCEGNDDTFTVHIGKGFDTNATNISNCIESINNAVGDQYPYVRSCQIMCNNFHYILRVA